MLRRVLLPASGLVALPFGIAVYAGKNDLTLTCETRKAKELPIYAEPLPARFEMIVDRATTYSEAVHSARQTVTDYLNTMQDTISMVNGKWDTAVAHTADALTYIQEDSGILPRVGIIALATLGGVVAGYRSGVVRKTLYGGVWAVGAASLCYPHEAVRISRDGWQRGYSASRRQLHQAFPELDRTLDKYLGAAIKRVDLASIASVARAVAGETPCDDDDVDRGMSRDEDKDMYTEHERARK